MVKMANFSYCILCHSWKNKIIFIVKNISIILYICSLHVCMLSCFGCVWLCVTPWTVAGQAPLSMGLPRQEYWSSLPFPSPADLPNSGILHWMWILYHWATRKTHQTIYLYSKKLISSLEIYKFQYIQKMYMEYGTHPQIKYFSFVFYSKFSSLKYCQ